LEPETGKNLLHLAVKWIITLPSRSTSRGTGLIGRVCIPGIPRGKGKPAITRNQEDFNTPPGKKAVRDWAMMESSRRYILQAEVEYWHEMLHLNRDRLSEQKEIEMRFFLKRAVRELNGLEQKSQLAAA
jgi:hypothetical protein